MSEFILYTVINKTIFTLCHYPQQQINYTYDEHLSIQAHNLITLQFNMLYSDTTLNIINKYIRIGAQVFLKYKNQIIDFTINKINTTIGTNAIIYEIEAQDTFSYQYSHQYLDVSYETEKPTDILTILHNIITEYPISYYDITTHEYNKWTVPIDINNPLSKEMISFMDSASTGYELIIKLIESINGMLQLNFVTHTISCIKENMDRPVGTIFTDINLENFTTSTQTDNLITKLNTLGHQNEQGQYINITPTLPGVICDYFATDDTTNYKKNQLMSKDTLVFPTLFDYNLLQDYQYLPQLNDKATTPYYSYSTDHILYYSNELDKKEKQYIVDPVQTFGLQLTEVSTSTHTEYTTDTDIEKSFVITDLPDSIKVDNLMFLKDYIKIYSESFQNETVCTDELKTKVININLLEDKTNSFKITIKYTAPKGSFHTYISYLTIIKQHFKQKYTHTTEDKTVVSFSLPSTVFPTDEYYAIQAGDLPYITGTASRTQTSGGTITLFPPGEIKWRRDNGVLKIRATAWGMPTVIKFASCEGDYYIYDRQQIDDRPSELSQIINCNLALPLNDSVLSEFIKNNIFGYTKDGNYIRPEKITIPPDTTLLDDNQTQTNKTITELKFSEDVYSSKYYYFPLLHSQQIKIKQAYDDFMHTYNQIGYNYFLYDFSYFLLDSNTLNKDIQDVNKNSFYKDITYYNFQQAYYQCTDLIHKHFDYIQNIYMGSYNFKWKQNYYWQDYENPKEKDLTWDSIIKLSNDYQTNLINLENALILSSTSDNTEQAMMGDLIETEYKKALYNSYDNINNLIDAIQEQADQVKIQKETILEKILDIQYQILYIKHNQHNKYKITKLLEEHATYLAQYKNILLFQPTINCVIKDIETSLKGIYTLMKEDLYNNYIPHVDNKIYLKQYYEIASKQASEKTSEFYMKYGKYIYEGKYENDLETDSIALYKQAQSFLQKNNKPITEYNINVLNIQIPLEQLQIGKNLLLQSKYNDLIQNISGKTLLVNIKGIDIDLRNPVSSSVTVEQSKKYEEILTRIVSNLK